MIRLIASDIDGTLLLPGSCALSPELFALIRSLRQKGVYFCAASGRRYHSLCELFGPAAGDLFFLCDNGALIQRGPTVLAVRPVPRQPALRLIEALHAQPGCEVHVSTQSRALVWPAAPGADTHMRSAGSRCSDLSAVEEPFLKVTAYMENGVPQEMADRFAADWGDTFNVALAGRHWLDFTATDKGQGLAALARLLGVAPQEVAAFGDNFNDLPMLRFAGQAWAMQGAPAPVLAAAGQSCAQVEPVLRSILASLG